MLENCFFNQKYEINDILLCFKVKRCPYTFFLVFNYTNTVFSDQYILRCVEEAAIYEPAHCPNKCGRFYKGQHRKINLRRHIFECGVQPRFSCSFCKKRFFRKYQLKIHLVNVHNMFQDHDKILNMAPLNIQKDIKHINKWYT